MTPSPTIAAAFRRLYANDRIYAHAPHTDSAGALSGAYGERRSRFTPEVLRLIVDVLLVRTAPVVDPLAERLSTDTFHHIPGHLPQPLPDATWESIRYIQDWIEINTTPMFRRYYANTRTTTTTQPE